MYFFIEQSNELNKQIEKLAEKTNYDTNQIWVDAQIAIQEKYTLPAFHILEDGYTQGDASDGEVFEAAEAINKIDYSEEYAEWSGDGHPVVTAELDEENEDEIITDIYEYLDKQLLEQAEIEISKVIKANWIQYYEDDIREFLEENYFNSGCEIGVDYSVWINTETGEIFEHTEASSNWQFQNSDENRKQVLHLSNYDKSFNDYTDLIAENDFDHKAVSENLGIDLPANWDELEYQEKVNWVEGNASEEIESYNKIQRDEAIDTIIDLIEDHSEEESQY